MASIKKNFIYQIGYRILTIMTPLITSPIISRALGAQNLGIYSATQAYVNYFTLFSMLGIEYYGNRTIAAHRESKEALESSFWSIYAVQFCSVLVTTIVYSATLFWIPSERRFISILQAFWLLSCLLDINWFFFGIEQFKLTVTRNLFVKAITVVLIVLLIRKPDDLYLYTAVMSGSMAISQILLWSSLFKVVSYKKPKWDDVRKHIAPIFRLFIPVLGLSVFHIMDKTMLDLLSDEANVGYYYSADKVINIPLGVISAVSTVMLPRIAFVANNRAISDVKALLSKSSEIVACLSAAVGFGIASIAKDFVPLFFGDGFEPCIQLIYWFVPVLYVKSWGEMIRAQFLIPMSRDKLYTYAVFGGAFANLLANYVLIIKYAALGAVLGTLIAESVVMVIEIIGTKEDINFVKIIGKQSIYILFGLMMLLSVRAFGNVVHFSGVMLLLFQIMLGAFIYIVLCLIYWVLNPHSFIKQYINQLKRKR